LPRIGGLHHRYEWRKAAWNINHSDIKSIGRYLLICARDLFRSKISPWICLFQLTWQRIIAFNRHTEVDVSQHLCYELIFAKDTYQKLSIISENMDFCERHIYLDISSIEYILYGIYLNFQWRKIKLWKLQNFL
jgi:hypothetical protein